MRFIFGLVVGIALTIAGAAYHDNNLPANPQSVADRQIVNWDVLQAVTGESTAFVTRWWDGLMGRAPKP
jgi:hypothetical protein